MFWYWIVVRDKYQAIGMIQVDRELSFSAAASQFVTPAWAAFRRPEIHKTFSRSKFSHTYPDFFGASGPVDLDELRILIEGFSQLLVLEGYIQTISPSRKINLLG